MVVMAQGPHMEFSGKAIIARDPCHIGVLYTPVLHLAMALRSVLFPSEP